MDVERGATEHSLGAVHQLRALVVELHSLGTEFARVNGLHATDVRALICLLDADRAGRPATPTWLRERLHLESASVTALIDRMEKAGHVRRRRDERDRRRVLLEVTSAARDRGWEFFGPLIASATTALDAYGADERATINRFLTDMRVGIDTTRAREVR
ncbi:DNA-binding MarR family transcriptional regulator [Rhodococcus sp. SMB37]|uniref:MarR family winged helix-turn-helix transcriptional regulator n=1 Tax=Rhodococcus sp. SMB37 TaxID=2512213 RepID=UPI0006D0B85C|nr:MarR family winged helix-turn-helix transcriptional regulator [Rhodococcus sp. SMB37]TCN57063.1 DNA-binding MarR family transcriptional regulator [Rhodococcus sp. SMB37]